MGKTIRKKKWFWVGMIFCFLTLHISSEYIWKIEIAGNSHYTDPTFFAALRNWNCRVGMLCSDVMEEELELRIRKQFPKITWASVSQKGSGIYIRVKEEYSEEIKKEAETEWDLVSEEKGIVAEIVTRNGVAQIKKGDPVEEGQILISGTLQKNDDFGGVIDIDYVKADGEISLFQTIPYKHQAPLYYTVKEITGRKTRYGIRCFGKYIPFYRKIKESDMMVFDREYYPLVYDSIVFPFIIHKKERMDYIETERKRTKEEGIKLEEKYLEAYLCKMEKMGVQIIEKNVKIGVNENNSFAEGSISVIKKVGTRQRIEKAELTGEQTDQ